MRFDGIKILLYVFVLSRNFSETWRPLSRIALLGDSQGEVIFLRPCLHKLTGYEVTPREDE
ncbi:hypothetical protein ABAC402_09270 [Asticcacaulis sp. AC402]|nr:hypothetical protein ABAC402_09270 [Asticcacaulis sp. AC402]